MFWPNILLLEVKEDGTHYDRGHRDCDSCFFSKGSKRSRTLIYIKEKRYGKSNFDEVSEACEKNHSDEKNIKKSN